MAFLLLCANQQVSSDMNKSEYFQKVMNIVSDLLEVSMKEIVSDSRAFEVVDARWIAIKLMHDRGYTTRQIAPLFNRSKRAITHALLYFRSRVEDPFSSIGNNYEIAKKYLRNSGETTM